jgi:hypothetical protein
MDGNAQEEFCALCGSTIPAGTAQFVIEGSACTSCAAARTAQRARKLSSIALCALLATAIPLLFSYATMKKSSAHSNETTTITRIAIFVTSQTEAQYFVAKPDASATQLSYSDPVAMFFGGGAVLLGLLGAWQSRKAQNRRSLTASGFAAAVGALQLLHGAGVM